MFVRRLRAAAAARRAGRRRGAVRVRRRHGPASTKGPTLAAWTFSVDPCVDHGLGSGLGSLENVLYLEQQQLNMKMRTACHMEPRQRDVYTQNRLVSPPCARRLSLTVRPLRARLRRRPAARILSSTLRGTS